LSLVLSEHPGGVVTEPGRRIAYDIQRNEAHFGAARIDGAAVVWELEGELEPGAWVLRCDRVDFPPGGIAYRHVHPGGAYYPGEPGYETWPAEYWKTGGGANNWPGMVLDEKRGMVFAPTGSAVSDFYGAAFGTEYLSLMNADYRWDQITQRYGFDLMLLPVNWPLASVLKLRSDWRVVADDGVAILFERRSLRK